MKSSSSEIALMPYASSERAPVAAAWAQFQTVRQTIPSAKSPPSFTVPGYRLLTEIHRGGQGVVYQAIQESTRKKVAIKILREGPLADSREFARFDREVEILSRINHPHIVAIHERGLAAGHAYFTMDFIAGRPLDAYVAGAGLTNDDILRLFAKICDAVNVAHLRGVIHRDLKPANIRIDEMGEPKILDFGLAKVMLPPAGRSVDANMTNTGQFVGSLPWASPEQAEGRSDTLDLRTDVYSLGVILFQLLTGDFPYPVSGQIVDIIRHITQTSPMRLSSAKRRIDRDIELIVLKALSKEPERRYQTAGDFSRDIRRYLANEPIDARPSTITYQARQFVRRHKVFASSLALIVLIIAAATAGMTWALLKANDSNQRAMAIADFMREVFTSVDPMTGAANARFSDVLARASASVPGRFAGQPLQEAEVRDLLGQIYNNLTMWNEAREQYAHALDLWRQYAGPDDPRTLNTALHHLGAIANLAQAAQIEKLLPDMLPRFVRVFAPDDLRTLDAQRIQAIVHIFRGRMNEAEQILRELRNHPKLSGSDGDELQIRTIHSLNSISFRIANDANPWKRAEVFKEMEPLSLERIERASRRYGHDAPSTLFALERHARILCGLGRFKEAAAICRNVLSQSTSRLGSCHYIITEAMGTLAEALTRFDESREAAELCLSEVSCTKQRRAPGDPALISSIYDALRYLERAGLAEDGEALVNEMIEMFPAGAATHGGIVTNAQAYLARFLSMQNRYAEADEIFQQLLSRNDEIPRAGRARLHLFYGHHLLALKQFEQAGQQFDTAAQLSGDVRNGTYMTHPDDIILGFIALCEATGDQENLAKFRHLRDEAWALSTGQIQP